MFIMYLSHLLQFFSSSLNQPDYSAYREEVERMIRISIVAFILLVGAFLFTQSALGQTMTPTTLSPTPTRAVPSGAPATGFGN